jgi:CBS domain containing-hemolysin-like protein
MAIEDTDNNFSTKNTSLAAYLYMEGFELLDVHLETGQTGYRTIATFIFESNNKLPDCVHKFQIAKAEGNLVLYFEAYKKCLRMTKLGKL